MCPGLSQPGPTSQSAPPSSRRELEVEVMGLSGETAGHVSAAGSRQHDRRCFTGLFAGLLAGSGGAVGLGGLAQGLRA